MNKNEKINLWFEEIQSLSIFHPEDSEAFKISLIKGLMENNKDLINLAHNELIGEESDFLDLKIQDFNKKLFDDNIYEEIEKLLVDQKEFNNTDLRNLLIEAKLNKNIEKASEYVKKKIIRKKISFFNDFLQKIVLETSNASESKESSLLKEEKREKSFEETKSFELAKKIANTEKKIVTQSDEISKVRIKNFFVIFETFEDTSSEYKMNKIKFNLEVFENLINNVIKREKYEIVGLYGNLEKILTVLKTSLEFEKSDNIQEYLSKKKINECVFAITNGEKILLIFITTSSLYSFSNKADSSQLITIYLRFLVDLCRDIFYIPSDDFQLNPDDSTPFSDKVNRGLQMIEKIVEPSDKIKLDEIPLVQNKIDYLKTLNLNCCICCSDSSKFITKAYLKIDEADEPNKQEINLEDIHPSKENKFFSSASHYKPKRMDYNEIKSEIKKYWVETDFYFSEDNFPRKFEDKTGEIFRNFISKEFYKQFQLKIVQYQDFYFQNKAQIEADFINIQNKMNILVNQDYDKIANFILDQDCKYFEERKVENNEQGGVLDFFKKNKNECTKDCKTFTITTIKNYFNVKEYPHIDWSYLERFLGEGVLRFHRWKKARLAKFLKEINKEIEKNKEEIEDTKKNNLKK